MRPAGKDQSTGPGSTRPPRQHDGAAAAARRHLGHVPGGPVVAWAARPRHADRANDASWSRYDVAGRTVYLADTAECAYAEVLAYIKRRLGRRNPLAEDVAAAGLSLAEFISLVGAEWAERWRRRFSPTP